MKGGLWILLALPFLGWTFLDPVARMNQEGNALFEQGEYAAALGRYLEAQQKAPGRAELHFNAADALYKQGKYAEAMQELGRVTDAQPPALLAAAYYNLGNALFRQEQFGEAVEAFIESLRRNPDDVDAKINLELALGHLQEQQQQKEQGDSSRDPDPQDSDGDGPSGEKVRQDTPDASESRGPADAQDQPGPPEDPSEREGAPQQPEQMTPEEAQRILDALKDREADLLRRRPLQVHGRRYTGEGW